jgi:hypothetical protein
MQTHSVEESVLSSGSRVMWKSHHPCFPSLGTLSNGAKFKCALSSSYRNLNPELTSFLLLSRSLSLFFSSDELHMSTAVLMTRERRGGIPKLYIK